MFTTGTRSYFEALPDLPGTDPAEIRRILTSAYIDVVSSKLELNRATGPDVSEVTRFLRRLGSALSIYSQTEAASHLEVRHAAAFVAAEAFFLLAEHRGEDTSNLTDLYIPTRMFEAAEASLLYLIAGHDSNAAISAGRLLTGRFGFPSGPTAPSAAA
jgi:hypothetical protein